MHDTKSDQLRRPSICNVWALVYGLCNYLDDNDRTLLLQYLLVETVNLNILNPPPAFVVYRSCQS